MPLHTRDRIVEEALRLFSENGFRATSVARIEAAAGLSPGSGALYKHFRTKRDVLDAAVEQHVAWLTSVEDVISLLPLGDLTSELTLMVKWTLKELDREKPLFQLFEREGEEVRELRDRFYNDVVQVKYDLALEFTRRWLKELPELTHFDDETFVAATLGAVINYRRTQWTFGRTPLDVDDDRFITGFVDMCLRVVHSGTDASVRPQEGLGR